MRERGDDLRELTEHYLSGKRVTEIGQDFWERLYGYCWPGNVRELKQKIQTAVLQSEGDMITEADLELDNEPSATSACFTLKSGDEERGRILRALKQAAGNKKMAAKILGIGRTTLYNKLVEYGLNEEN